MVGNLFLNVFIFLFGLIVGSFLNCVIYRLAFPRGRSFCPHCKHILSWKDLIPILSFLILRGRCRYCGKKISWQYSLVELATALLFLLIFNFSRFAGSRAAGQFPLFNLCFLFIVSCFLIVIFVYDLKHYIIPDRIIFPAIIITILYRLFEILNFGHWDLFGIWDFGFGIAGPIINPLAAGMGGAMFFLIIFLISRGKWLGFGDVKLAFLMGLFLGFPDILVALFLAFFIGAIIGLGLIFAKKKTLKSEVPFGPFLVAGTFIALFWGQEIIRWYFGLLGL